MIVYIFDQTFDGVLSAVFDAYFRHQSPDMLLGKSEQLPLFCEEMHEVVSDEKKAQRVWAGLEKRLSKEALHIIMVSWMSEEKELNTPLFHYIYKVFQQPAGESSIECNFSDPDVLYVTNTARRVLHEQLRMKQFIRFQKAKDGTYLAVVSPDNDVLPLITDHFQDRFNDQPWLIYDAKRHYGYYYTPPLSPPLKGEGKMDNSPSIGETESLPSPHREEAKKEELPSHHRGGARGGVIRITFEDESTVPFNLENGKLNEEVISSDDRLLQDLWRTYFKAICIKERMNPKKQLSDMPRRYWKYMTEKN